MSTEICPHCGESYENRIYYTIEEGGETYIICPDCDELIVGGPDETDSKTNSGFISQCSKLFQGIRCLFKTNTSTSNTER